MTDPVVIYIDEELEPLIPNFIRHRYQNLDAIREALRAGDWPYIQTIGHQMKGSGHTYGLDLVSDMGFQIETAAKIKDEPSIRVAVTAIQHFMDNLKIEFVPLSDAPDTYNDTRTPS